jgi:hypothetical protein
MTPDETSIIATEQASEGAGRADAANEELRRAATMATMVARVAHAPAQCKPVCDFLEDVMDLTGACALSLANPRWCELRLLAHRHLTPGCGSRQQR